MPLIFSSQQWGNSQEWLLSLFVENCIDSCPKTPPDCENAWFVCRSFNEKNKGGVKLTGTVSNEGKVIQLTKNSTGPSPGPGMCGEETCYKCDGGTATCSNDSTGLFKTKDDCSAFCESSGKKGLSVPVIIIISVVGAVVLGVVIYLLARKKK